MANADPSPNLGSRKVLTVLFAGVLMGALDIAIVGPALPAIGARFEVGQVALSWTFTVYVLFNLAFTPVMAKLSDRLGRRRVYVLDVLLFGFGSLVVAAAPSFAVLLVGRALQATGAGGIFPVASAVIGDTYPEESRGRALGILGSVFGLAFVIGPILGGLLLHFGWRWLFIVNVPIAIVLAVFALRLVPDIRPGVPRPFDRAGVVLLAVGLGAFALGVGFLGGSAAPSSEASVRVASAGSLPVVGGIALLLVGMAALMLFWRVERRAADPVVPPRLLASAQVRIVALLATGAGMSEAAMVFLPSLAVASLGFGESTASFMLLPLVIALGASSPVAGRLLDRIGARPVILAGVLATSLGSLLFGLLSGTLVGFVVASLVTGIGLSALLGAPLRYVLLTESGEADRGASQGLITVFLSAGQLVGAALIGAVAATAAVAGLERALVVLAAVLLVLAVPSMQLRRRRKERPSGAAGPV